MANRMSYNYSDEEDIDIHVRRGRASPAFDQRPRHNSYYSRGETRLEIARGSYERSRSRGFDREIERERIRERPVVIERERPVVIERERPVVIEREKPVYIEREKPVYIERERPAPRERAVTPQPIVINNIMNQEEDDYDDRYRLAVAAPARTRSRSRRRESEARDPGYMTKEEYELERTRKELEQYKLQAQREDEEKLIKKELELKRLREEKKAEEEKKAKKEAEERAIKEYKAKEAEKREKEEKEKKERDAEYKKRLEEDLRRSGIDDRQISIVLKKEKDGAADPGRPTYTRMARRYLSIETLRELRIDYTLDTDPEYILIKRWVPEYEQDYLWNHTRELRELRERSRQPVILAIEEKKTTKHHNHRDDEFEIVRKHKRKNSPSPLVTFFAGGKR